MFCSPSAAEGYGLTLAEAVAAGVPVVACDTGAVRETVSEAIWVSAEAGAEELRGRLSRRARGKSVVCPWQSWRSDILLGEWWNDTGGFYRLSARPTHRRKARKFLSWNTLRNVGRSSTEPHQKAPVRVNPNFH